ncbi:sideroflexin-1 [Hyposmocoma kahamanoa]|uniref:sideroflexin-1 n=1 Tax=Hyposmocoma kahamanoa TaxID=1477025 RepID=UPI000E6D9E77|nr:sideroflexin-1 [Hyposmocoma kahamanoa]
MSLIDLTKPRWDQNTYWGRATHFFHLTNPLNVLASDKQLDEAKKIVTEFRKTQKMPSGYDEEKLWAAKYLYDSAFHPDTGEKMILIGRMAAQAPMNTLITGGMITFYRTTAATVFWQWLNQTFNAIVNYTNRGGDTPIPVSQMVASYCCACGGALGTALYLNSKVKNMNPLFARFVPFAAVAGANCLNIPMMRSSEIINGTPVFTLSGERIGESRNAARYGISLVVVSRIFMAIPGMILTPMATNFGLKRGWFRGGRHWLILPFQLASVGFCVTIATPLGCAMFPQQATFPVSRLEPELAKIARSKNVDTVVYNKGL